MYYVEYMYCQNIRFGRNYICFFNDLLLCRSKTACDQASLGIAALFGPTHSQTIARHMNALCQTLEIPHLEARLDPNGEKVKMFAFIRYNKNIYEIIFILSNENRIFSFHFLTTSSSSPTLLFTHR